MCSVEGTWQTATNYVADPDADTAQQAANRVVVDDEQAKVQTIVYCMDSSNSF